MSLWPTSGLGALIAIVRSVLARRTSLRLRLLLGTLVWIAVSVVVAGWALSGLFKQHVAQQFNAELGIHLDQLAAHLAVDATGGASLSSAQSDPRFAKPLSGLYWQIDRLQSPGGPVHGLLRSRSLWDNVLALPLDTPTDGEVHQHRIRGPGETMLSVAERVVVLGDVSEALGRTFRLVVAADERQLAEPIEHFNGMLWLALGLLGAGLALVTVIQVRVALAPLRRLRDELTAVRRGESPCLPGVFPGEVQPLVDEFNSVLAQNAEVVQRARTQAGNLAHALKTPLSVINNAAREAGGAGDASDGGGETSADPLARLVLDQIGVARRHIDYHLSRSRVAASRRLPGVRTTLSPVVEGLVRVMRRIHAGRAPAIALGQSREGIAFRGEEQDLQEMLGNLIDNACKWAAREVVVGWTSSGRVVRVFVDDDGPGIPDAERARVLSRGERADEQVPGSGLGLAIVGDLATLYGGRLELDHSPLGGLRAELTLPLAD